jgi:hypothetical protein
LIKDKDITYIVDYIFKTYIFNRLYSVEALTLIKILSVRYPQSIYIYTDELLSYLKENDKDLKQDNKIKQIVCDIYGNVLIKSECKTRFINNLENILIHIILNRPSSVMISAIEYILLILVVTLKY